MDLFKNYVYLKPNRLSDVIRLISVLGIESRYSFRKEDGLNATLNGPPKSGTDWIEIAKKHPEFFKINADGSTIVLLLRFLNRKGDTGHEVYSPLTIDETQNLINQAISLHDKQIARFQKNSFLIPILTAVIAALTTGFVAYFTIKNSNTPLQGMDKKIDTVIQLLNQQKTLKKQ